MNTPSPREDQPKSNNRYSDRAKSYLVESESPPRSFEKTVTMAPDRSTTSVKNSPLQPNRTSEHKFFEGERYSLSEIKNEDRGEWRERALLNSSSSTTQVDEEVEQVQIKQSPSTQQPVATYQRSSISKTNTSTTAAQQRVTAPVQRPTSSYKQRSATPNTTATTQQQSDSHSNDDIPHYMQITSSFKEKTSRDHHRHNTDNLLRPRSQGGITKRVGTTKIPRYQASTSINAIHDIQSEMAPDDVYIPMAARIKLFEKGLGNASNKPAPIVPHRSSSQQSTTPQPQSKRVHTPTPSASSTTSRRSDSPSERNVPSYARKTVSSETREIDRRTPTPTTNKSSRLNHREHKPFHFATSERGATDSFHEKLNLWKSKDKIATINSYNNSKKRKASPADQVPNKHIKYN